MQLQYTVHILVMLQTIRGMIDCPEISGWEVLNLRNCDNIRLLYNIASHAAHYTIIMCQQVTNYPETRIMLMSSWDGLWLEILQYFYNSLMSATALSFRSILMAHKNCKILMGNDNLEVRIIPEFKIHNILKLSQV